MICSEQDLNQRTEFRIFMWGLPIKKINAWYQRYFHIFFLWCTISIISYYLMRSTWQMSTFPRNIKGISIIPHQVLKYLLWYNQHTSVTRVKWFHHFMDSFSIAVTHDCGHRRDSSSPTTPLLNHSYHVGLPRNQKRSAVGKHYHSGDVTVSYLCEARFG